MINALVSKYSPIQILLADDDPDDKLLFSDALSHLEVQANLITVNDGEEVIQHINMTDSLPHIIFLDLNMPRMNGLKCLELIRQNHSLNQIPCVILSTSSNPKDINKTYETGANLYFAKPAGLYDLIKMIDKTLKLNWEHFFPPFEDSFFISDKRL
ncbi:response regulator [Emticicia fontis]